MPGWQAELRPLPQAAAGALSACLLLIGLAFWSGVQGQWASSVLLAGLTGISARGIRRDFLMRGPGRPRLLVRAADGRWWLQRDGAAAEPVDLDPACLQWGRCLLLILRGSCNTWLWLGPGNVPAPVLAALRRELAGARGPPRRLVA